MEDRFWAKVEKTEGCWNWVGYKQPAGYGTFHYDAAKKDYVHRISWRISYGDIPEGLHVDHICHNRACVNPEHLRAVSIKQNMENRTVANKNSATGIRGVYWNKQNRKYAARVAHNRKVIHVGYFDNIKDAEEAVIEKRRQLFTHSDMDAA